MSLATFMETLVTGQVDGTALASSTAATSIIPAAAKITLPTNYFQIGKKIHIKAMGRISNIVTTPGTLTLDVRFGSVIVFTSQALALNIVAKTNVTWYAEFDLLCRTIGNGTVATMMGAGKFISESVIGSPASSAGGVGMTLMPASAPAVGTGFDSTASQTVDLFATWSVSNAANSIQVHEYEVIAQN